MAASTPLLPTALRGNPSLALRAATFLRQSVHFVAVVIFTTVLFAVAVRNTWGDRAVLVYFICCYILILGLSTSTMCISRLPHGTRAATWAYRVFWFSLAGVLVASMYKVQWICM